MEAVVHFLTENGSNPGRGSYSQSALAAAELEETRSELAAFVGAGKPEEIVFTLNATDSLNLAIRGLLRQGDQVVTTVLEHNSVLRPLRELERRGEIGVTHVAASFEGEISIRSLENALTPKTRLLVVTHGSNVLGTITPVEEISAWAKAKGLPLLVDAAQTIGHLDLDVREMKIPLLAASGHKGLMGPQGTGFLYVEEGILLRPLRTGGTGIASASMDPPDHPPLRYEAGTPNTPGIFGLGAALQFLRETSPVAVQQHEEDLTKDFLSQISRIEGIKIHGPSWGKPRLPIVAVNVEGQTPQETMFILHTQFGIETRHGLHCAPLVHRLLNLEEHGTLRFSFGYFNTHEEIEKAAKALSLVAKTAVG